MRVIFSLICMSIMLISDTVNEQIHALENATPTERVALMNKIKEQLIEMNDEERMSTISTLQKKLHIKNKTNEHNDLDSSQNISKNQEHKSKASTNQNLEHHELQEQMSNHHQIEEEVHQQHNVLLISHEVEK